LPPLDIATLQKRLGLVVIESDAERKLLLTYSAAATFLTAQFEQAKQGCTGTERFIAFDLGEQRNLAVR
jgi:hypothetical protein